MTQAEFIEGLTKLGPVQPRKQPDGRILAILEARPVPGTKFTSRVAFMLTDPVQGRPQQFVDDSLRTRTGGLPNNWSTTLLGSEVFATWSFNCPWDPATDSPVALVMATLAQWDR